MDFIRKILDYYYTNTEQGRRERLLGLEAEFIDLTSDFPYYTLGIRALELTVNHNYDIYADMSFLCSEFYKQIFKAKSFTLIENYNSDENYYYSYIYIISNDPCLDIHLPLDNDVFYNIDLSNNSLLVHKEYVFEDVNFFNYLDNDVKLLNCDYYIASYVNYPSRKFSFDINRLNRLVNIFNNLSDSTLDLHICFLTETDYYEFISKLDPNMNYSSIDLSIHIKEKSNIDKESLKNNKSILIKNYNFRTVLLFI